jgi:hypothetical protein
MSLEATVRVVTCQGEKRLSYPCLRAIGLRMVKFGGLAGGVLRLALGRIGRCRASC